MGYITTITVKYKLRDKFVTSGGVLIWDEAWDELPIISHTTKEKVLDEYNRELRPYLKRAEILSVVEVYKETWWDRIRKFFGKTEKVEVKVEEKPLKKNDNSENLVLELFDFLNKVK